MERTRRVITDNSENNLDKVLIKTFTHKYRAGYVEVGGTVISDLFLGIEKDIENFEVFNDDIWLLSFPKSGTTWTSEMVWLLANNLDYETAAKEFLPLRFPAIEAQMMYDWKEMQMDFQQYEHPFRSIRYCANLARPRLIKSHLPWPLLPRQIRTGEKTPRIIYVSRDPRDVIVSYFHYSRIMDNFSGSFDDFFNLFIGDKLYPTPYWKHVLELWNRRSQPNVLFLKYEDMLKSISQVAAETASFLERKYTDDDIARVAGHLAFENMKDNQSVNLKWALKLFNSFGLGSGQGDFMRKGTVGDHVTLFTDAHRDVVRKWSEELLAGSVSSLGSKAISAGFSLDVVNIPYDSLVVFNRADLFKRDLLCPEDLSSDDLKNILWTAIDMKHTIWKPGKRVKKSWLRGYNVAVVDGLRENKFTTAVNNSVHMLGANLNQIQKTLNDEDHELNEDDGRLYGTLSEAVFVTAIGHKCLEEMARGTDTPIINIRTRKHQLLKAMADAMTMLEYFGYLKGLTVGYLGKPTPLLNSYVCLMPLLGINLKFRSCEEDHDTALTPVTMDVSKRLSLQSKSQVKQCDTCTETMDGLDVIVLKKAPIKKEPSRNACADKINLQDLKNLKEKWMLLHSFPSASFISKDLYCHENNKVLDSIANVVWISAACLIRVVKGYEFKRDMPDFDNHADR